MGPSGRIGYILHILDCLGQDMQVLYLGRALRTKETLPDFLKWRRVTRHPLVFRGLMGSQRTPGFGASQDRYGCSFLGFLRGNYSYPRIERVRVWGKPEICLRYVSRKSL